MPVRLRITILFTILVLIILGIVCSSIYFFSHTSRLKLIKTRLTNRAITTGRILSQGEIFDRHLLARIDSLTTISLKNISVQAYNHLNREVYIYSDSLNGTLHITPELIEEARTKKTQYFTIANKEVIAYNYTEGNADIVVFCAARDEAGKRNLIDLKNILALSFVAGITIAFVGGLYFSRRLLSPIKKIANEVTDISAQNFTRRIQTGQVKDEWFQLSSTFNDLLNRLQESFELQRRFISNASHELSTPLTSISSQLEISLQRERSNEQYKETLLSVLQDVKQMNKLTQTLLEFAKAAGDKGGLNINLVRIDEVLMELPAFMRKQIDNCTVALKFGELPENEEELLFFGNAELLFTAIKNIAINACKYSPDHKAEITLEIKDKQFEISIADNGPGIAPEELSNIFQPFYRLDNSRSTEGFGLGLSLAYRIVKLHKGDIQIQSAPGEGAIFTIYIPSARKGEF
jgi:signal transduction histidine kinase